MSSLPELIVHREDLALSRGVLFIHGYGGRPAKTWGDFPTMLAQAPELTDRNVYSLGYTTRLAPEIRGGWKDLPRLANAAELLRTTLTYDDRLGRLTEGGAVAIVAHSMGGLVAQRALCDSVLADDGIIDRVGHLLMFGTPSGGFTRARRFTWFNRQIGDMADDSEFITGLRRDWAEMFAPSPFAFKAGAGEEDAFVPAVSSLDPFERSDTFVVPGDHLSIVKPGSTQDLSYRVVTKTLRDEPPPEADLNEARVAVELKDYREAIRIFGAAGPLDDRDAAKHAIALDGLGRTDDALALLRDRDSTDARGTLAGRLKRRWWAEDDDADAQKALELYAIAFEEAAADPVDHPQAYYHAINAAYLELALNEDGAAAAEYATRAIHHADHDGQNYWQAATIGEAHLYLGDCAAAIDWFGRAVEQSPSLRRVEQTAIQAERVAVLLYDDAFADRIRAALPLSDDG